MMTKQARARLKLNVVLKSWWPQAPTPQLILRFMVYYFNVTMTIKV